jgi:hypothetical protein
MSMKPIEVPSALLPLGDAIRMLPLHPGPGSEPGADEHTLDVPVS